MEGSSLTLSFKCFLRLVLKELSYNSLKVSRFRERIFSRNSGPQEQLKIDEEILESSTVAPECVVTCEASSI